MIYNLQPSRRRTVIARSLARDRAPITPKHLAWTVDDAGVSAQAADGSAPSLVAWSQIASVYDAPDFLFFWTREGRMTYIPRRAFGDREDLERMVEFARERVAGAAAEQVLPADSGTR